MIKLCICTEWVTLFFYILGPFCTKRWSCIWRHAATCSGPVPVSFMQLLAASGIPRRQFHYPLSSEQVYQFQSLPFFSLITHPTCPGCFQCVFLVSLLRMYCLVYILIETVWEKMRTRVWRVHSSRLPHCRPVVVSSQSSQRHAGKSVPSQRKRECLECLASLSTILARV